MRMKLSCLFRHPRVGGGMTKRWTFNDAINKIEALKEQFVCDISDYFLK